MRRRGLVIGSQTYGLTGVRNDVDTMSESLGRRGFTTVRCEGADATRAGILDAYERLIRDTRGGDAVVVYYSGHGGLVLPPAPDAGAPMRFIVPTDHDGSNFRGITAAELSALLVRLTEVTRNVTVILDTCHAAHPSRDADLRVKALPGPVYADGYLARLVPANRDAVRVVACGPQQSAYEYTNRAGYRMGILTESLALALTEATDRSVSWAEVIQWVRRGVRDRMPVQRPDVEGPARRLLFEAAEAPGSRLRAGVRIKWGLVVDGRPRLLPAADALVDAGAPAFVWIRNDRDAPVYVSVIEATAVPRVVTSLDPFGIALKPGEAHVVGRDRLDGRLIGFLLRWPPGADRRVPCRGTIVVTVSTAPATFRDLAPSAPVRRDIHAITYRLRWPGAR